MKRSAPRSRKLFRGDSHSLRGCADDYLEWMLCTNHSEKTVAFREEVYGYLINWCEERGIRNACEITKPLLERYQRYLYHYKKRDGRPLSFHTQYARLAPVKSLFKWLCKTNRILFDPASGIELPKWEKRLPKHILNANEADTVLNQADITTLLGLRDRAILETLYSTGIRRLELSNLQLQHLDVERGTLVIRQGKNKKDRMVPIGERAVAWIQKYLLEVRPTLVQEPDDGSLWLNAIGQAIMPKGIGAMVRDYVKAADIGKTGGCHLFRHTVATLMLEGGADIRYIQAMLGHSDLATTEVYTRVSIRKLKEVHTLTHPARLERGS